MGYKDKVGLKIVYEGRDITIDLMPYLISLTYRDKAIGEADELTIVLRNNSMIWMWVWNPKKGDTITAEIAQGNGRLDCGKFTVDEPVFTGGKDGGHICTINALGAGVKDHVRTKSSFAHEGKSLKAIAEKIAAKYKYKVQGIIHNYSIGRVTQWHETDLGFLHRIAAEFGYLFSLKGDVLVFTYFPDLNNAAGALTVKRSEVMSYTVRDKVAGVYVKGQNRYYNPKKKKLIENSVDGGDTGSADTHRTHSKVDDDEQGLYRAGGRLYKKNMDQVEIDVQMPGNIYLLSGNNVNTEGWFNYNGVYMIGEATHTVTKDGNYTTGSVFKKIVKNKGGDTGGPAAKKTGMENVPDVSAEAKVIYDTVELLIAALKGGKLDGAQASVYNARINGAILGMRNKGAGDLADEVQAKYGGAIGLAVAADAGAEDEAREIQGMVKVYMK